MAYDNAVYGMKFRKWFGLSRGFGGASAAVANTGGFNVGSGTVTHIASWYPHQPIKITKFGVMAITALDTHPAMTHAGGAVPFYLGRTGFVLGTVATDMIASLHTGALAKGAWASQPTMSSPSLAVVNPGSYLVIRAGSVRRSEASVHASSVSGVVAFFVDYTPQYSSTSDAFWTD